jgi:serine/threonine protein kinase
MEYAVGGSLHLILSSVEQKAKFSPKMRLQTAEALVAALQYLHSNSIFHRDIKPENICFWEGWETNLKMVLIDFGIASRVAERSSVGLLTKCAGTIPYMADECLSSSSRFTEKSEAFAVGVVLANLLTGDCLLACLNNHRETSPGEILLHADSSGGIWVCDIDKELAAISCQCLLKDPKQRPTVSDMLTKLKGLHARISTESFLDPRVSKRIRSYNSLSRPTTALSPVGLVRCVVCSVQQPEGALCPKNHLTCSSGSCLDELVREHLGLKKFKCPASECSEHFEPIDLYGKLTMDLYGTMILAADGVADRTERVDDWKESILSHIMDLKLRISQSEHSIKGEIRASAVDIIGASLSVVSDSNMDMSSIKENIQSLLVVADKQSRQQDRLEKDLRSLIEKQRRGEVDTEAKQQEILTKLESLSLSHAGGVALIASGRIQCPRLCLLCPVRSHRGLRSRLTMAHEYQLIFLCAHDKSPVATPVIIKEPKKWLKKAAPVVKFALFTLRAFAIVYGGIPLPSLPECIVGKNLSERMDQVLKEMEILVTEEDIKSVQDWLDDISCQSQWSDTIASHESAISEEAYSTLATEAYKPNNRGWMNEMEIAQNDGGVFAWVKKENAGLWKSSVAGP